MVPCKGDEAHDNKGQAPLVDLRLAIRIDQHTQQLRQHNGKCRPGEPFDDLHGGVNNSYCDKYDITPQQHTHTADTPTRAHSAATTTS